jgi:hypothetical protein
MGKSSIMKHQRIEGLLGDEPYMWESGVKGNHWEILKLASGLLVG